MMAIMDDSWRQPIGFELGLVGPQSAVCRSDGAFVLGDSGFVGSHSD
jgi:hypothetical protein